MNGRWTGWGGGSGRGAGASAEPVGYPPKESVRGGPGPEVHSGNGGAERISVEGCSRLTRPPQPAPSQPGADAPAGKVTKSQAAALPGDGGAGILALLCLGGVGVFISFYDEATKIERSKPDAVADQFLRAYLVNRDDKEVSLFTCKAQPRTVGAERLQDGHREPGGSVHHRYPG
nr:hypothetical protein GCM10020092_006120 [Actinoplanes digitatis]